VFLELDQKRVARALPSNVKGMTPSASSEDSSSSANPSSAVATTSNTRINDAELTRVSDLPPSTPTPKTNPFNLKEKALQASSAILGKSIQSLYAKLESDGFNAGEEFTIAAREGLTVGSTIVLGDQDVEITLRRLTEALGKTDIKKLLAADSELERNMKGLLPEGAAIASSPGLAGSSGGTGVDDTDMSKEQFSSFIETMKAKENVRLLMGNLRTVAPEPYMAMVGERDEYMGLGLDRLNQFESTVAVMGIAHVDGVERTLRDKGWKDVPATCPVRV